MKSLIDQIEEMSEKQTNMEIQLAEIRLQQEYDKCQQELEAMD